MRRVFPPARHAAMPAGRAATGRRLTEHTAFPGDLYHADHVARELDRAASLPWGLVLYHLLLDSLSV